MLVLKQMIDAVNHDNISDWESKEWKLHGVHLQELKLSKT